MRILQVAAVVLGSCISALFIATALHADPDWSASAVLPEEGHRANIYQYSTEDWQTTVHNGKIHALNYPVAATGLVIPYRPFAYLLDGKDFNILRIIFQLGADIMSFGSTDEAFEWLGLHPYPTAQGVGPYEFPYVGSERPKTRMGLEIHSIGDTPVFTFGCATCHVGNLFGKTVFGMTNRFPHANEAFVKAKQLLPKANSALFRSTAKATEHEMALLQDATKKLDWVGVKNPQALGLDTSLAQVGLSLSRRDLDPYAAMSTESRDHPRPNILDTLVADSKPAVWWNLKYKTRWLSDGSIISGNPVFTNFLWNELGRAADLHQLENWLDQNRKIVDELTTAVFAAEPPLYTDFFKPEQIKLAKAQEGEVLFNSYCSGCHGQYVKNWSSPEAHAMDAKTLLKTQRVIYHSKTPVVDVGTDPNRYKGMTGFADRLNELALSQKMGTVVQVQKGYVPPPLVGIWARWPYFHNNSAPSLCVVLTRSEKRPTTYYAGAANDPDRDFDKECNGYPSGLRTPLGWMKKEFRFDTSLPGLSNMGHDEGIFLSQGKELLTSAQKMSIIEFLKTL